MFQAALFTMFATSNLGFHLAIRNNQICKRSHFSVNYWDEMVQSLEHVKSVSSQIAIFLWVHIFRNNKSFFVYVLQKEAGLKVKTDCTDDHLRKKPFYVMRSVKHKKS